MATTKSSKEQQRNAKAQAVWQSLRHEGDVRGTDGTQEYWTCASQSTPGARYTITHDLVSGNLHCTCVAGTYGHDCVHQAAVRRYISSRAEHIRNQAALEARMTAEQHERDTAMMRRSQRAFSLYK
jgi:hypothetical protein